MAELAALGLAGNIVQFVDFGIKLFSEGHNLYTSATGSRDEDIELESITRDLLGFAQNLHSTAKPTPHSKKPATDDVALQKLASSCEKLADELLKLLEDLKVKGQNHRKWESFRQALRHVRKDEKINKLEERLEKFQRQITTHLVGILSNQQSSVVSAIKELQETNDRLEANTTGKLDELRLQLLEILETIDKKPQNTRVTQIVEVGIPKKLEALSAEGRKVARQQEILASLRFASIQVRHNSIKEAHAETFQWIFGGSQINFKGWLDSGSGIYWVQGKAGSGKSTLLRYLAKDSRTRTALQHWSGSNTLCIASHFFWNAGNLMQKSQQGLLQTLLYQVLRQFPDLIPTLCHIRWSGDEYATSEPWSFEELVKAFEHLAKLESLSAKLCFFVDGLDEYDGNHTELTNLLKKLASSPSIKLCVSSRPWNSFIKAFVGSEQLKLEDLTKDDIKKYVRSKLEENQRFREFERQDPRCNEIVTDMVQRAQGVFLWVYLVVESLLKGLDEGDDARDLRHRLESLPDDLEDYFRHMLESIDSNYREQTYKIFQISAKSMQPLPVLAFSFLEEENETPDYALEAQVSTYSDEQMAAIYERMKERLNARCKDLLEVNTDPSEIRLFKYKVDFLHRTVRDFFIRTTALEEILKRRSNLIFDAHISLCRIMLALTKVLVSEWDIRGDMILNLIFSLADELMYHAWQFEKDYTKGKETSNQISVEIELLDELDRVLMEHSEASARAKKGALQTRMKNVHWTNARDLPKGLFEEYQHKTFLASAIQFKLTLYVRQKLDSNPKALRSKDGRPLLDYALRPMMVTPIPLNHLDASPDIDMVRLLLEKGANPNQSIYIYDKQTTWSLFMQLCYNTGNRTTGNSSQMYELLRLLINNRANTSITFKRIDQNKVVTGSVTMSDVLRKCNITNSVPRRIWYDFMVWYCDSDLKERRERESENVGPHGTRVILARCVTCVPQQEGST